MNLKNTSDCNSVHFTHIYLKLVWAVAESTLSFWRWFFKVWVTRNLRWPQFTAWDQAVSTSQRYFKIILLHLSEQRLTANTHSFNFFLYIKKEIDHFILTSTNLSMYKYTSTESHCNFRGTKTGNFYTSGCTFVILSKWHVSWWCQWTLWQGRLQEKPGAPRAVEWGSKLNAEGRGTTAQWHVQCEPQQKATRGTWRASASDGASLSFSSGEQPHHKRLDFLFQSKLFVLDSSTRFLYKFFLFTSYSSTFIVTKTQLFKRMH